MKMKNELSVREHPRLKGYDYSSKGAYFVTFCVKDGHEILGRIVGRDAYIAPQASAVAPLIRMTKFGETTRKYIENINKKYQSVYVDKYVIMPNHVHMVLFITDDEVPKNGAMWASRPTNIPNVIRSLKTMITKEIGFSLWQTSYHDHIIRNKEDYKRIWQYIDENPVKWTEDVYYTQ